MMGRFRSSRTPILLAASILAIVLGAAIAFALSSDDDEPSASTTTPTATANAATETATPVPPTATATASPAPASPVTQPTSETPASEVWSIDFQRSGGFAGLSQSLSVSSDGAARYEDARTQRVENGTLDAADLAALRALIDSSAFFSQAEEQDAPCADCFNLSITVMLNGDSHTVHAVDIAVDATLQPFVDKLAAILQDGLAQ
jgi:Emfourin